MRPDKMMKILCITMASLAMLSSQLLLAYDARVTGQKDPGKNQTTQRGEEVSQSGSRGQTNPLSPAQNIQPKPWEIRPWEQAQEDLRRDELGKNDMRKMEERRRAGRKARKERLERLKEKGQATSYEDRTKQRQTRWQRHQLQSDRYVAGTLPQK